MWPHPRAPGAKARGAYFPALISICSRHHNAGVRSPVARTGAADDVYQTTLFHWFDQKEFDPWLIDL
jgi:hypothetical protein